MPVPGMPAVVEFAGASMAGEGADCRVVGPAGAVLVVLPGQLDAEAHGLAFGPAGANPVLVAPLDWAAAAEPGVAPVAPRLDNEYCLPVWKEKQL